MRAYPRRAEHGSLIVYVALALVIFGLLTIAGVSRFGSSVRGVLAPNCATAARYMAEAGLRYAAARLRACTDKTTLAAAVSDMNGHGLYTVDASRGLGFSLNITYDANYTATVVSTGKGCSIIAPVTATASASDINLPVVAANSVDPTTVSVTFSADLADFTIVPKGKTGAITKDMSTQSISLGNDIPGMSSAIWYTGNNALCKDGACRMGNGLCATYSLQFNPYASDQGDGLAWVIMNAASNTADSFGGRGEYIGYAGVTTDGASITQPKLVMEYDITPNYWNCGKVCQATDQVACDDGTDNAPNDHVAFMYWGYNTVSCGATMDDHIHGSGAGSDVEPYNSYNFDGQRDGDDGYYSQDTGSRRPSGVWLRANNAYKTFYIRYELDRATTPNAQGDYVYRQRAWISGSPVPACSQVMTSAPTVVRSVALSPAQHAALGTAYFGWTTSSGSYTQIAKLSGFALTFKGAPTATVPAAPAGYVAGFPLDEGAGATARDTSSNAFAGALTGSVMWTPDARTTTGTSLFFSNSGGTSGYVSVPDAPALRLSTEGTIACWAYVHATGTTAPLVYKYRSYALQFNSNRTVSLVLGRWTVATTSSTLPTGSWCHVAATWNGSAMTIYFNGTRVTSTWGASAGSTSYPLLIGGNGSTSFDGRIDDVYIYNRALSASEIATLASGAGS